MTKSQLSALSGYHVSVVICFANLTFSLSLLFHHRARTLLKSWPAGPNVQHEAGSFRDPCEAVFLISHDNFLGYYPEIMRGGYLLLLISHNYICKANTSS